ncbi:MAG: hypothetical protein ACOC22_04110 [bacterium]
MTEENNGILEDFSPEVLNNEEIDESYLQTEQNQDNNSPLVNSQTSFKPDENQKIIGEISPAGFDNVMKILRVLIKSNSISTILIRQSQIVQEANYFIEADMREVLNYNNQYIDLDITNPNKVVKKFEEFRNSNNIFIIEEDENSRYILTNGQVRLYLPKQEQGPAQQLQNYDLENSEDISQKKINKSTRNSIRNLSKESDYVEWLIQDNQLKAISVPDGVFVFDEFINDANAAKLDETNAELTLRSGSFLPVEAEEYDVFLKKLADGNYVIVTTCRIGQINIRITESCDVTTGGNLLI